MGRLYRLLDSCSHCIPTIFSNDCSIAIEKKKILDLENKTAQEERKSKKVTFKEGPKKKTPKTPFDIEGLQKVLKSMSNDMVDI